MKLLVLLNPSSNGGRARRTWRIFAALLPEHDIVILQNIEEAQTIAKQAVGYDIIVGCGGDGTINAVANGVLRNPDHKLKFGVLYAGTSPDFCTFHRIPLEPSAAVECLLREHTKKINVLTANGTSFFCSCNLGMGANVATLANRFRPVLGDKLGTCLAVLWNLLTFQRQNYFFNDLEITECDHLLITRMPYIAGGLKLNLPQLQPNEYAVWYLQRASLWKRLALPWKLYRGHSVGTVRIYSTPLTITSPLGGKIEYDGDPHGDLPLDICFSQRTLQLITGE